MMKRSLTELPGVLEETISTKISTLTRVIRTLRALRNRKNREAALPSVEVIQVEVPDASGSSSS